MKQSVVIRWVVISAYRPLLGEMSGAYVVKEKWILGYGTRLVCNSWRLTFTALSNLIEAVTLEAI